MDEKVEKLVYLAIEKEELAYNHYLKLLRARVDFNLEKLFTKLAIQELKHVALLRDFLKTKDFMKAREKIYNRAYDYSITEDLNINFEFLSLKKEILKAIERENNSYKFYLDLFVQSNDENLKNLFYFLSLEEMNHKHILKNEYDKLK
ncbi:MAG: ferritin family protein [Nanoarchaeota archaeon]